ncbi:MAG: GntR family transcriptional regulator [Clostridium sp.]|uniref:GntR family transcriptional regulator n=1 Tax=Clostridium sp. DSM 8431 TaxID=1761781 RepID=UPI0008F1CF5A|nr:GntR family transcriptional regulator [Clostridium sp. DSM 8431]MCR4944650.1 GntR family transcriptional regulator [Clostridium sp.]SFU51753.1 DNA-binding transcriptional regulator, GntR family [Clostridium sp. DSM 8431]
MILYEKNDKESGKDYAYRVLRENIMTLELKPGELLSEVELSEKLGISRTPIREVLMKLKSEHLIEVKPQSGTYVSLIDLDLVQEARFMRFTLEEKVLKEACENFDEKYFVELEKNLYAQQIIAEMDGGEKEFHKLDNHFHELFFLGVNKGNVWKSILNISTHYNRMRLLSQSEDPKRDVVEQHREFIKTVKNKEIDKVESMISRHMKYTKNSWEHLVDETSEFYGYFKKKNQ